MRKWFGYFRTVHILSWHPFKGKSISHTENSCFNPNLFLLHFYDSNLKTCSKNDTKYYICPLSSHNCLHFVRFISSFSTYIHTCTLYSIYTNTNNTNISIYIYVCVHVCIYTYICVYICYLNHLIISWTLCLFIYFRVYFLIRSLCYISKLYIQV